MHPADKFIKRFEGPLAVVRSCTICGHFDRLPKVRGGGRGWGMREGNKQRGRLIQHILAAHPESLKEKS